jgi:hypothetical protein
LSHRWLGKKKKVTGAGRAESPG